MYNIYILINCNKNSNNNNNNNNNIPFVFFTILDKIIKMTKEYFININLKIFYIHYYFIILYITNTL